MTLTFLQKIESVLKSLSSIINCSQKASSLFVCEELLLQLFFRFLAPKNILSQLRLQRYSITSDCYTTDLIWLKKVKLIVQKKSDILYKNLKIIYVSKLARSAHGGGVFSNFHKPSQRVSRKAKSGRFYQEEAVGYWKRDAKADIEVVWKRLFRLHGQAWASKREHSCYHVALICYN